VFGSALFVFSVARLAPAFAPSIHWEKWGLPKWVENEKLYSSLFSISVKKLIIYGLALLSIGLTLIFL
jgi:hypothetical protein